VLLAHGAQQEVLGKITKLAVLMAWQELHNRSEPGVAQCSKLLVAQPIEHFAEIVERSQSSDDLHELKTQHLIWNQFRPSVRHNQHPNTLSGVGEILYWSCHKKLSTKLSIV
jgi:hypothetical protein